MNKNIWKMSLTTAFAVAMCATGSLAQTTSGTGTTAKGKELASKTVDKVTCAEFNGFDESFKPKVIAWAAGYRQGQKQPDAVAIDIDGVEKVTPIIVEECRKAPTATLWSKIDAEMKKVF